MRNRNTNIFLRGTAIFLLLIATVLTTSSLIGYSRQRNSYPPGMTIAGVPVGGLDAQTASERVLQVYKTPIQIQYGGGIVQIDPTVVGFELDMESMLAAADLTRMGGSFWGGYWDYLWNRDATPEAVPLRATIAEERLRAYLQTEIAPRYDQPSAPPQLLPGSTTTFASGQPGETLDMEQAVPMIEDALRSPSNRSVSLTYTLGTVARPTLANLQILLKQNITTSGFDGIIGIYMLDLQSGQEIHFALNQGQDISVRPDLAFSAQSTIKIPILISYFIQHGAAPVDADTDSKIVAMIHESDNAATDDIMRLLDPNQGPLVVTEYMQKLGLENTFIGGFFCSPESPCPPLKISRTPSNSRLDSGITAPDVENQTTPSDMGMLLEDLYQCAQSNGGALIAAFPDKLNKDVCNEMLQYLEQDRIGVLIAAGLPEGTTLAHKHGWTPSCNGCVLTDISDAGVVYTPGGNFVLAIYTYRSPNSSFLFDPTNQLIANLAETIYNYFNLSAQ